MNPLGWRSSRAHPSVSVLPKLAARTLRVDVNQPLIPKPCGLKIFPRVANAGNDGEGETTHKAKRGINATRQHA
jgi:hypothetical protein